jgi:NAD(P)-dependent dehydrogenase (short-subunit alcohol dehydrogenase family)
MDLNLSGRVAIVTGGSKGIGLAVVRGLRAEGARVVCASRTPPPEDVLHVPVDLTDPQGPAAVIAAAVEAFGGVDILVNNAGGPPPDVALPRFGFLGLSDDDWLRMFDFNLLSAVRMCREAIPLMLERGGGSIVNVSSRLASIGVPTMVVYSASKGALLALTRGAAIELAPHNVRVNAVAPGLTATPLFDAWVGEQEDPAAFAAEVANTIPQGRVGTPEEVAAAVAYLAADESAHVTGASIPIDGGYTAA